MKVASLALAIALVALAPKAFPSAPSKLKSYPGLNYASTDAWIIPSPDTQGIGVYVSPKQNWSLAVERGSAGTDTSDDYCSRVQRVDAPVYERPFGVLFLLGVRNTGLRIIGMRDSAFSLVEDDSATYSGIWFGPSALLPGDSLYVDPGKTDREYIYFGGLPRVGASIKSRKLCKSAPSLIAG